MFSAEEREREKEMQGEAIFLLRISSSLNGREKEEMESDGGAMTRMKCS
jgi:hypothetical protein